MVRWALAHSDLLPWFSGRLLLLAQCLDLQLDRLLQGLLGGRLCLWLLALREALVHLSRYLARGPRTWTGSRTRTRGSLLTVGNVGLFASLNLGASLGMDSCLEERPGDRNSC